MSVISLLKDWIIPPGYIRAARSVMGTRKAKEPKGVFQAPGFDGNFNTFRNSHNGERCFILATGPSIKSQDLTILKGEKCIAVSWFHLHESIDIIRPIWHVFAPLHHPFDSKSNEKLFDSLSRSYANWSDIQFLFGHTDYEHSYYNFLTQPGQGFGERYKDQSWFLDYRQSGRLTEESHLLAQTWDMSIRPFELRTVIYPAIQLAYFLGFSEIILVGCDHDYLADITRVENHHFYAEAKGVSDKEHLMGFDMERWFYEYYMRWKDYRLMREFMESRSVKLINATKGGMLNVFPRASLETLITHKI